MDPVSAFDEEVPVETGTLQNIARLGKQQVALEQSIINIEDMLKAKKSELQKLRTVTLPDAMAAARMLNFTLEDGSEIEVKDFVSGGVPKDPIKRDAAFKELEQAGGIGLIKNDINVSFTRNQHNEAVSVAEGLKESGYVVSLKPTVHVQSLYAFVRDKLRNGEKCDYTKLGIYVGRITKLKVAP